MARIHISLNAETGVTTERPFTPDEEAAADAMAAALRRPISKALVQQRLIDAGKIDAAFAVLMSNPSAFARWFAPGHDQVYADDAETLAMLDAIGADPDVILG